MKIMDKHDFVCEICAVGKMMQYKNRKPDKCTN